MSMALAVSSSLAHCPKTSQFAPKIYFLRNSVPLSGIPPSSLRPSRIYGVNKRVVFAASSAAGSSSSNSDLNSYEVLGVSPIEGFDMVKAAYTKKKKDAERRGVEATAILLEKAYDKIMMSQLTKRKKGETFGSFKVSKDIRFTKSEDKDIKINLAISAVFDEGRMLHMGKRLLRSLALVFGCIAIASLGYTGLLNLIEVTGGYIPRFLYNNQELLVTASTAFMLYIMASYYRSLNFHTEEFAVHCKEYFNCHWSWLSNFVTGNVLTGLCFAHILTIE